MKSAILALCIKNRQGFTLTGREIENGQVILRMQNFRQGDTNVITLDAQGVTRLRKYLQELEAKAGVPQMTQEQSKRISENTRQAYVHAQRECCNADCGWKGVTDRVLSGHGNVPDVGPLCPECGETTELAEKPKREPVLARPEHGCSVEQAMALTMERYGQPGGALEQLAELERNPVRDYCVRSAERMRQIVHVVCHNCDLGSHSMLMRADVDISTIEAPKCLCGAQTEWAK